MPDEIVAESGCRKAAHHRDAERAADLAGRVVDRGAHAGAREGNGAHDRGGRGWDEQRHSKSERKLAGEDDPVAAAWGGGNAQQLGTGDDEEPDDDGNAWADSADDARR